MKQLNGWVCTDPNLHQYGIKIKDGHYQFKEFDRYNYTTNSENYEDVDLFIETVWHNEEFWVEIDIILAHYTEDQVTRIIKSYYSSIDEIKVWYGEEWGWIVAECIFEYESGLY